MFKGRLKLNNDPISCNKTNSLFSKEVPIFIIPTSTKLSYIREATQRRPAKVSYNSK